MNLLKSIFHLIRTIILTALLVCLVIFMINNRDIITIHLHPLPFDAETRVFLVMIIFFLLGLFFGLLACSKSIIKRLVEKFKDRKTIKKLEKQVAKN